MFAKGTAKHTHWDSALRRFANSVEIKEIAEIIGMNPQTLRNKLNPAQPHELTAVELLTCINSHRDPLPVLVL